MFFKNRNLNIALLISISWHLICIFLVTPVLGSGGIKENSTTISFLGSILGKIAVVPERSFTLDRVSLVQKIERMRDVDSGEFDLTSPESAPKIIDTEPDKEKFVSFGDRYKAIAFKMHHRRKERSRIKFRDVAVTGEARNRTILYRPALSKILTATSYFSSNYNVNIKFNVSEHGFVERPECVVSSGYPEIDQIAVRYVRMWQFVPYSDGSESGQEGVVRLNLETL